LTKNEMIVVEILLLEYKVMYQNYQQMLKIDKIVIIEV
jgi:hypothetical protein